MLRWNQFEEKWLTKTLMKPSVRKNRDYVFSIFHQLNLKDAASYVAEVSPGASSSSLADPRLAADAGTSLSQGERRGSLEFVRNETAIVDFKKKFGAEFSDVLPDVTADVSDDYGQEAAW